MSIEAVDLAELIPGDMPDGREVAAEGRAPGDTVEVGQTLYCKEKGVGSEREWREIAREKGIPCSSFRIGLNTWEETRAGMVRIYEDALARGVRPPDRIQLIAERRMGLPKDKRAEAPQETGPSLWTDQDWWELANTVPIYPETADNMIGGPGSLDNAIDSLRVGITTIGALSQFT